MLAASSNRARKFDHRGDLFAGRGRVNQRFDYRRIAAGAIKRDLDRQDLRIFRGRFDQLDNRIETFVGMMEQDILLAHHFEDIGMWRQGRIARRLEEAILQFGEGVVRDQRHQMRHRERPVQPVKIGLAQIEELQQQLAKIFRAIGLHFQTNGVAAAGTPQFMFDAAQKIFGFFLVDVEIAVPGHAKSVHAIENQPGKQLGDVMFDEGGEINVIPRFVLAFAAGHQDQARQHARHLDDGVKQLAAALGLRARTSRLWLLFSSCGKRMAGIDRQRREHRENFFLEITPRPGGAFRVQLRDFVNANPVLGQRRRISLFQSAYSRRDQFVRDALDGVESFGRAQPVRRRHRSSRSRSVV